MEWLGIGQLSSSILLFIRGVQIRCCFLALSDSEIIRVNGCMYLRLFMANFQVSDCFDLFRLILHCGKCEKSVSTLVCTSGMGGEGGSPAPQ